MEGDANNENRAEQSPEEVTYQKQTEVSEDPARGDDSEKVGRLETPERFEFDDVFTYGVCSGKYGGYNIPINMKDDDPQTDYLYEVAEKHGVIIKTYGRKGDPQTMYLKCDQLSVEHKGELLAEKNMIINVVFEATRIFKMKDGEFGFRFRVLGLKTVGKAERILDPAPERL